MFNKVIDPSSFPKIFHLGKPEIQDIFKGEVEVTEKVDGCFTYESKVTLEDGTKIKIGKLVNEKKKVNVLCLNKDGLIESKPVVAWHKNGTTEDWLRVRIPGFHGQDISLQCTPNHKILTKRGWVEAKDLEPNDLALVYRPKIDEITQQIVLGCLLGDASISGKRLSFCHSIKQSKYIDLKKKLLQSLALRDDTRISGYGSTMKRLHSRITPDTKDLYGICTVKDKKRITKKWLDLLTPVSLAFWYMDDGSLSFSETQTGYAVFHTNGFSKKEVKALMRLLQVKFGLSSTIRYNKGYYITLDTVSTERLFSLIFPYVPGSMQYKLYEKYRFTKCVWDFYKPSDIQKVLVPRGIKSVVPFTPANKVRYDIEVEGNHNYMVGNVVVHNSQVCFGINSNNDLVFRSKGKEMFFDSYEGMFEHFVTYLKENEELIRKVLDTGTFVYGEYLRNEKHNILKYDRIPDNHVMVFGVMLPNGAFVTKHSDLREWACALNLRAVPLLYSGKLDMETKVNDIEEGEVPAGYKLLKDLLQKESILGGELIEGVVVKNYFQRATVGYASYCFGKYVREAFKERHRKEWKTDKSGLDVFIESFRSEARWMKAIQHLEEKGELEYAPRDIGKLMKEIHTDIEAEEEQEAKEFLWRHFKKQIIRRSTAGAPEWYKEWLLKRACDLGVGE